MKDRHFSQRKVSDLFILSRSKFVSVVATSRYSVVINAPINRAFRLIRSLRGCIRASTISVAIAIHPETIGRAIGSIGKPAVMFAYVS